MNIEFPTVEAWDSDGDKVTFPADSDGKRIVCAISWEALTDHFGADRGDDPIEAFRNNRAVIEQAAEKKILAGHTEDDGSILLYTAEF